MGSDIDCESKKPISPLPKPNLVNERPIMKLFYFERFISWHQTRLGKAREHTGSVIIE